MKTPAIAPPMSPSHVFFGERRGASLWRPSEAPGEVRRRVGRENGDNDGERDQAALGVHLAQHEERAEPSPIQAEPSTVEPTAAVVGARVSAAALRRNARTNVAAKPPSSHSISPLSAPISASSTPK